MNRWVTYEWDVEDVTADDGEEEVLDHHHADKLSEYPPDVLNSNVPAVTKKLVLVRDDSRPDGDGRLWAYVKTGELPEFFEDAYQEETDVKVPKRFHVELRKWWDENIVYRD